MDNLIYSLQPFIPLALVIVAGLGYKYIWVEQDHSYGADFGSAWKILPFWNKGIAITSGKYLSRKKSFTNFLGIGGTGSGKGVNVVIPTIANLSKREDGASMVVHDPSGETRRKVSGFLVERGYKVLVLNFNNPLESVTWNPITLASTQSDINKITSALSRSTLKESKDPFWGIQANNLISTMIRIIKTQEPAFQNLYNVKNVLKVLTYDPEQVDRLFSLFADEQLLRDYKSLITFSPKMFSSIVATSLAALSIFDDPDIARVTSSDSLDLSDFRKEKTCIFIQNSISEIAYYAPLTNIFIEQLFAFTMASLPKNSDRDVFFIIDEAGSLYIPSLPVTLANIRKHNAGIALLIQDYAQLEQIYGNHNAKAIRSNCLSQLYFKGQSLQSAKDLETMLGKYQYEDEYGKKSIRPLLTVDQIRMLSQKKALCLSDNNRPLLIKLKPYYMSWRLRKLCELPPPRMESEVPNELVPLLPL